MQQNRIFVGFSTENRLPRAVQLFDLDLIKQDILNHFHTRRGERVMMPEFGSIIWDLLFEPFTDSNRALIYEDVRRVLASEPRVELIEMVVTEFEHGIKVQAELLYRPFDIVDSFIAEFDRRAAERA